MSVIPLACIEDTLASERSRLGDRKTRLKNLLRQLQTLIRVHNVTVQIVEWEQDREVTVHPDILFQDAEELHDLLAPHFERHYADMHRRSSKFVDAAYRFSKEDLEIEPPKQAQLEQWATHGVDSSNGELARWLAELFLGAHWEVEGKSEIYKAVSFVNSLVLMHRRGRCNDELPVDGKKAVSNFYDAVYLIWVVRMRASLWTKDKVLDRLHRMAKAVMRHMPAYAR